MGWESFNHSPQKAQGCAPIICSPFLWRGSLLPLAREAALKSDPVVFQADRIQLFGAAVQPSGSKLPRHGVMFGWAGSHLTIRHKRHRGVRPSSVHRFCGEGACSRWAAQRPLTTRLRQFMIGLGDDLPVQSSGVGQALQATSQPNASTSRGNQWVASPTSVLSEAAPIGLILICTSQAPCSVANVGIRAAG